MKLVDVSEFVCVCLCVSVVVLAEIMELNDCNLNQIKSKLCLFVTQSIKHIITQTMNCIFSNKLEISEVKKEIFEYNSSRINY